MVNIDLTLEGKVLTAKCQNKFSLYPFGVKIRNTWWVYKIRLMFIFSGNIVKKVIK